MKGLPERSPFLPRESSPPSILRPVEEVESILLEIEIAQAQKLLHGEAVVIREVVEAPSPPSPPPSRRRPT